MSTTPVLDATPSASAAPEPLPKIAALQGLWVLVAVLVWAPCGALLAALIWPLDLWLGLNLGVARWAIVAVLALLSGLLAALLAKQRFMVYAAQWLPGEGMRVRSGVWWQHETWVPIVRIQHLDVSQGPLDRWMGMASLSLHTAGRHDHRTVVKGLPLAEAQRLRAALMPQLLPQVRGQHD